MFPPFPPTPPVLSPGEGPALSSVFSLSKAVRLAVQKLTALGDLLERAQGEDAEGAFVLLASQSELLWIRQEMPWSPVLEHGSDPVLFGFVIPKAVPFYASLQEKAKVNPTPRLLSLLQGTVILPPHLAALQAVPPLAALLPYLHHKGGSFVGGVFLPSSVVRLLDQDVSLLMSLRDLGKGVL